MSYIKNAVTSIMIVLLVAALLVAAMPGKAKAGECKAPARFDRSELNVMVNGQMRYKTALWHDVGGQWYMQGGVTARDRYGNPMEFNQYTLGGCMEYQYTLSCKTQTYIGRW